MLSSSINSAQNGLHKAIEKYADHSSRISEAGKVNQNVGSQYEDSGPDVSESTTFQPRPETSILNKEDHIDLPTEVTGMIESIHLIKANLHILRKSDEMIRELLKVDY